MATAHGCATLSTFPRFQMIADKKSLIQTMRSLLDAKDLTKKYENATTLMTSANDFVRAYGAYGVADREGADGARAEQDFQTG